MSQINSEEWFKVVSNDEGQYSLWPVGRENALGWYDAGPAGDKETCLRYISETWIDMRPISLRKKMHAG